MDTLRKLDVNLHTNIPRQHGYNAKLRFIKNKHARSSDPRVKCKLVSCKPLLTFYITSYNTFKNTFNAFESLSQMFCLCMGCPFSQ